MTLAAKFRRRKTSTLSKNFLKAMSTRRSTFGSSEGAPSRTLITLKQSGSWPSNVALRPGSGFADWGVGFDEPTERPAAKCVSLLLVVSLSSVCTAVQLLEPKSTNDPAPDIHSRAIDESKGEYHPSSNWNHQLLPSNVSLRPLEASPSMMISIEEQNLVGAATPSYVCTHKFRSKLKTFFQIDTKDQYAIDSRFATLELPRKTTTINSKTNTPKKYILFWFNPFKRNLVMIYVNFAVCVPRLHGFRSYLRTTSGLKTHGHVDPARNRDCEYLREEFLDSTAGWFGTSGSQFTDKEVQMSSDQISCCNRDTAPVADIWSPSPATKAQIADGIAIDLEAIRQDKQSMDELEMALDTRRRQLNALRERLALWRSDLQEKAEKLEKDKNDFASYSADKTDELRRREKKVKEVEKGLQQEANVLLTQKKDLEDRIRNLPSSSSDENVVGK
eukprot:jgi/Bigna1/77258/fgenesh1_pg.46_\